MNLIYERAWSFHRTTGIDLNELISEATLAYLEAERNFDERVGIKFTTMAYKAININLIKYARAINKSHIIFVDNISEQFGQNATLPRYNEFNLDKFPENVKNFFQIVLNMQNQFEEDNKRNKRLIRQKLREQGWSHSLISITLWEVKELLKKIPENELFS